MRKIFTTKKLRYVSNKMNCYFFISFFLVNFAQSFVWTMNIAIFGNSYRTEILTEIRHLLEIMARRKDVRVLLSKEVRDELNVREEYDVYDEQTTETVDFALSVGGDGTFLTTASIIGNRNVPILGINYGHLGFLADVKTDDVDAICQRLLDNEYTIEQRSLLALTTSDNTYIHMPFALNEISVMKHDLSNMIAVETYINGEHLHTYEADGLIISTPTGSTAYNMSVGGPLMDPHSRDIILSPIATHSLNVRPLIIPDDWAIDLKIKSRSLNYLVSIDGRSQSVKDDVKLHIEKAPYTIKLVQVGQHNFLDSLKSKLLWGAR